MTTFAHPKLLWLLMLIVPMAALYVYRLLQGGSTLQVSTTDYLAGTGHTLKYYLRHLPFAMLCGAVALLIVALARPQSTEKGATTTTEGIDIVLAMDVSSSMLARDFQPDRITAAREMAARFIVDRPNDRMGLVIFAGESFTQSPLTTDKSALLNLLGLVRSGVMEDGTAIGNGLATAVNRLKESDAESKVIVLLTDGVNNSGQIAPLTAAEIAESMGIRVYTIGVGTRGTAPYPAVDMWGNVQFVNMKVEIDEQTLADIAAKTGGEYFRATDKKTLGEIYDKINALERSKIDTTEYTLYHELYARYVLWALILCIAAMLVRTLYLKRIP